MNSAPPADDTTLRDPILPGWVFGRATPVTPGDAAFASGAALALVHVALHDPCMNVPSGLLRNRLALRAAANCCRIEGRVATEPDLRDAVLLTQPGDAMGPNGDVLALWRRGTGTGLTGAGWQGRLLALLPDAAQDCLAGWIADPDALRGSPVTNAVAVLCTLIGACPRHEAVALVCADAILARSLGWAHPLPLFGLYVTRKTLRAASRGEDITGACHAAVARAAQDAARLAQDLARRAARLRSVAHRLRSKGAEEAVGLFLMEDAVLPSTMLSPTIRGSRTAMTPRSARRICERLIELGVVRELTGRATFRLYGVA